MPEVRYQTPHGIVVSRTASRLPWRKGLTRFLRELDEYRGVYLSSGYEFPGRYSRWDIVSVRPPLELVSFQRDVTFRPLNERGAALNRMLAGVLRDHPHWEDFREENGILQGRLKPMAKLFSEEERSKQPSVFSILRALTVEFRHKNDNKLAFAGAFGYDLLFQFEPIPLRLPRTTRKDLQLFLCDDIVYMDRKRETINRFAYEFEREGVSTLGLERTGERIPPAAKQPPGPITSDHTPEEYIANVQSVREGMRRGDYYEVVLRQTFSAPYSGKASELFQKMQEANPSPYEFLLQFGDEQLVGASPEMFVRVEGARVETCPLSGTIRRTGDPLQDEKNIRELLNSTKEESELTMCTDVDRNDKSRVCRPGSVKVLSRRLIEAYSGLFHTADHVEGFLEEGFDSLDAFLSHMWAVTLMGAPKKAAAKAIEAHEKTARDWYGGAVGMLSLNGDINTGIAIRTTYLRDGRATYPAGATLLYDSDPASEERETRLKANGFFRLLGTPGAVAAEEAPDEPLRMKLLLVDNDDCFIHTLANYARQTGAEVVTYRAGMPLELLRQIKPDLILISPGPGWPADFGVPQLVLFAADAGIPVFGVCLGLQGIVEAFGGELGVLPYPMHGKASKVLHRGVGAFEGLPDEIEVGRYHSLYAIPERMPEVLEVTARTEDGVIMGVRHRELPIEAVQFHPESILSAHGNVGLKLIRNALRLALPAMVALIAVIMWAAPTPESFHFVVLGDRTGEAQPGIYEKVWKQAAAEKPAFVLSVGDTIQGNNDSTAGTEWQEVERTLALYRRFPLYLAPGNHDIWSEASEKLYVKYGTHPTHYSFDYGPAHFTVLDNSRGDQFSAEEMAYLEQDLKAHSTQPVKFIVSHRPSWIFNVLLRNPGFELHQLAKKYGVHSVIAGHVHEMLHFNLDDIDYVSMVSSGGHLRASGKYEDGWFFGYASVEVRKNEAIFEIHDLAGHVTGLKDWGAAGLKR